MKKKKPQGPRSEKCLADDARIQKEQAFQLLYKKWTPKKHALADGQLVLELEENGYSLRCIARNLPDEPDESVLRDLKERAKRDAAERAAAVSDAGTHQSTEMPIGILLKTRVANDDAKQSPQPSPGEIPNTVNKKLPQSQEAEIVACEARKTALSNDQGWAELNKRMADDTKERRRIEKEDKARSKLGREFFGT